MPQYQGVWTLEAQAQAQSNQQWVTDPNFKNTTLLLQADGTGSGSQNQTFLDGSTNNFFITRNGNTTQGSFSPFSQAPGYWSNFFDGAANSYLAITSNSAFAFGTGAYTVEGWIFQTARSTNEALFFGSAGSSGAFLAYITNTGAVKIENFGVGALVTGSANDIPLNTWCHVAYVRNSTGSNDTKIYVNGVVKATGTDATNWTNSGDPRIGMLTANTDYAIKGYLSNMRVVKGTAVYTSAFTPQTSPLTNITNTSLLTCQSNRFIDNSTNAFTVTPTGTMSVQGFGPFAPALQWTPTVVGGSGYFDGTGDYLNGPNASGGDFSTGDFTISAWFYPTTLTGGVNHGVMAYADTGGWNGWQLQARGSTKDMLFEFLTGSAGASTITGGTIVLNAWNYVVVTRSGSTLNLYVNSTSVAATTTNSTAYGAATSRVIVGADRSAASPFIGYISNSKLVKQANAPASIPTVPDTNTTNTSLLLNYTNAGIYDGAMDNVLETVGSAQVSTSPVKYGSGSMYFDGSGDYLLIPASQNFEIGSGDFTIECWVYGIAFSSTNGGSGIFGKGIVSSLSGDTYVLACNGGTLNLFVFASANNYTSPTANGPSNLQTGVWSHVAVSKANGITRVFLNGISGTPSSLTYTVSAGGNFYLATQPYSPTDTTRELNGYIDDLRVTKGIGRYIANFTPPQQALPRQ